MKKIFKLSLILLTFFAVKSFAQESIIPEVKYDDLEKYIALAKQNEPKRKILAEQASSIKTAIPMASLSYLDLFNGSYIYRPQGKVAIDPVNPYSVNGFQLGINLNLGAFLQKPFAVKKAKADYKVAQLQQQDYDAILTTEVKARYYDYIQSLAQLKIATQAAQDNKGVAESQRYKFEKGEVTLDTYNQSRTLLTESSTSKITAEVNFLKAKDQLEELIGVKLTDVK
ncbi:outer membrane protein TolC [Pedobacter sp. UYP30]|uniref:TolC family protein n=1 Tax=Pedobacter sp. UYP30 TaxID=1756400 RepID=UPI003396555D